MEKEYIIFCDESVSKGKFYSNFYGGLIVGASQYERITNRLNELKRSLNLLGEIKWSKVTERYLPKYEEVVRVFFEEVVSRNLKVRIMFSHNAHQPQGLTEEDLEHGYFKLYYQFIKHAFGLAYLPPRDERTRLRLYFDQFPDTGEKVERFKGFLAGLQRNAKLKPARIRIEREDITEIRSHDHVLLQCLDIVLGAMSFRLNNMHLEKPEGQRLCGKRTIAKGRLYKLILAEIRAMHTNFNVGMSTGKPDGLSALWTERYRHWCFETRNSEFQPHLSKRGQGNKNPT